MDAISMDTAETFVKEVMATPSISTKAVVHDVDLGENNRFRERLSSNKRSADEVTENNSEDESAMTKKTRCGPTYSNESESPVSNINYIETGEILSAIHNLGKMINTRIDNLEDSLSDRIKGIVQHEMSDMKADIDCEISELETKILKLENEKLESNRTLTHYVHELIETMSAKLPMELDSIVIKNMPELASEENDNRVTINRVTKLFKEGLKLPNINIINADRKKTSSHKPGVIVVQLQDSAQKKLVLETKSKLNTNKQFDKIYIESSMSTAELKTQSSLITLVKELSNQDSYFVKDIKSCLIDLYGRTMINLYVII
ncbi:hypothetical protein LOTGIDRAFT_168132 [Lottia gigantea]|uniref:Uncharacterized protein n=1 Tax=Lottia gigantea TaxID=225164 RepID=V3ZVY1_LOTGI|nr:hypothetical protein LOTGIDRAFT_168132 [Lottia gigantea]ESO85106.1 hypothetical protein LOTGIDRAFT_168132 [Lottia gigantea]